MLVEPASKILQYRTADLDRHGRVQRRLTIEGARVLFDSSRFLLCIKVLVGYFVVFIAEFGLIGGRLHAQEYSHPRVDAYIEDAILPVKDQISCFGPILQTF
jgi:hypothetical protein